MTAISAQLPHLILQCMHKSAVPNLSRADDVREFHC
jgi:hypothetical protein